MANIKISALPPATVVNDADDLVINQGGITKKISRGLVNTPTGTLPVANGGTGVTVSTGASSVVLRDASQNISVNSAIEGFTSVAASGTQITLTVASTPSFLVTGSGGQVIQLPNATTLQNGVIYLFNNNQSSGAISVNNNSGTLIASIPSGGFTAVSLLSNAIAAGTWERHEQAPSNVTWSTNTLDYAGAITSATWNGNAVAVNRGGTGQSTFTDGQLLIGNSTGNTLTKATLTAGTNVTITNAAGAITIASTGGGSSTPTDIQTFTSSGTWTKPAGAVSVDVFVISAGGGGASGRKGGAGTVAPGGGGGGGGSYSLRSFTASLLGATESVTVGAGGTGGAAVTVNNTNGTLGVTGGNSSFGTWLAATGGGGAPTVTTAGGGAGSSASSRAIFQGSSGGAGSVGGGNGVAGGTTNAGAAGGGGGGGLIAAPVAAFAGGTGGVALGSFISGGQASAGALGGGNGGTGSSGPANTATPASGGGGGGSSITATNGGAGGVGGLYGGGGGGGGAGLDSVNNSGAGGNGADGIVIVITYF